jgi:hypothetical protein
VAVGFRAAVKGVIRLLAVVGCAALSGALTLPPSAAAQEKTVSLSFTKELLYNIARDNEGEMKREHISRLRGLSPAAVRVDIIRRGGNITLSYLVKAGTGIVVDFNLTLEKMAFYRLATAREDIDGMLAILAEAKKKEPLILDLAYRFDEHYSIVDVTLDLLPIIRRREKEAIEKAAAAFVPPPPTPPPPRRRKEFLPAEEETPVERKAPPAKPPPEKIPEREPVAEKPPPKERASYLSVRALGDLPQPVLDGIADDPAWKEASRFSFDVKGASGNFTVTLSALRGEERIYFLVQWPDRDENVEHRPWVWSKEREEYVVGKEIEDAMALQFAAKGWFGECMLSGKEAVADLWYWRAGRTNPVGFAEDGSMTVSAERIPKANFYQAKNRKTIWVKENRDPGVAPYRSQVAGAYEGERVRRYVTREPSGSAADVTAKGAWKKGTWTVEFSRLLQTADPADTVFPLKKDRYFSVAVFNGRERSEHSASGELHLRLE